MTLGYKLRQFDYIVHAVNQNAVKKNKTKQNKTKTGNSPDLFIILKLNIDT